MAMQENSLEKLLGENLKDIYDAEHQILEALPKMTEAASSKDLKKSFEQHESQTRKQAERLEKAFKTLDMKPSRKKCVGMEGIIKEGQEHMKEHMNDKDVLDATLIAGAQKVEHYEISAYGTVKTYAQMLGRDDIAKLLDQTLTEEYATDEKLTALAESHVNFKAMK